uniref:Uncharacterized protein n=1 Tax=Rhizophora mucronata TaxID=61149 RepID=A0A2P2N4Y8_RHIMU
MNRTPWNTAVLKRVTLKMIQVL